eukprot:m.1642512 g.1642512  ORF g.1642512 m.1642512 type:complete len:188 (-) comp53798_c0_seq1:238-801(-)
MVKWYLNDLAKNDPQVRIVQLAAWTTNQRMKFFLTKGQDGNITDKTQFKAHRCNPRSNYQPASASSLFSGMGAGGDADVRRKRTHQPGLEIEVDAVDFSEWFADQHFLLEDEVILKIDIEGAELPLLKKFLTKPPLPCLVDVYYVEWHSWMIANPAEKAKIVEFETTFLDRVAQKCNGKRANFSLWH